MASTSSVCPLPCTPAMATTSPGAHVEAHVVDDDGARRRQHRRSRTDSPPSRDVRRVLVDGELDRAADHERGELGVGRGGGCLAHDLAEADHGDAVGDCAHLAKLVGDEDDGGALVAELAHDRP